MVLYVPSSAHHSDDASALRSEGTDPYCFCGLWFRCGGRGSETERERGREGERERDLNAGPQRIRQPDRVDLE